MADCTLKKSNFRGWDSIEVQNEHIRLVAVPDIGGRVMAYDLGNLPMIFVDNDLAGQLFSPQENQGDGSLAAWKNYGGDKTWPSPQGWDTDDQWHGPPDPVLDTGKYQAATYCDAQTAWIEMTSPADQRTGVQIRRRFEIHPGSSRVTVKLTFTNISQRKVKWSIWDVMQLDASLQTQAGGLSHDPACSITTQLNPESRFDNGYYVMFGDQANPQWKVDRTNGLVKADYLWEIGKIGVDTKGGWVAFTNPSKGCAFAELFKHFPGEEYPDDGVGVEYWTVGRGKVANLDYEQTSIYLMEVEVLSPYYQFLPGQVQSFDVVWGLSKVDGQVLNVLPGGCTTSPLKAAMSANIVNLSGAFGVFDAGELLLHGLDAAGTTLFEIELQEVAPDQPLQFKHELQLLPGLEQVLLFVRSRVDQLPRLLAECRF